MRIQELTENLKLTAFYTAYVEQETQPAYSDMPFNKRVQILLEAEAIDRDNKKLQRLLQQSKLHDKGACITDINFAIDRGLDKSVILDLAGGNYLKYFRNIILTGATGTGKSYIAQAYANKAMVMGHSALYLRVPRLMQHLQAIRGDEEYLKYLTRLKKINLLILDDFGVSPLKAAEARDLLEIVEDRTNQSSTIITSQLPIKEWHSYLHNATIADAILDRIVHNSYKIELEGESQRKERAKNVIHQEN
jgi:DNA replication protein DnaC